MFQKGKQGPKATQNRISGLISFLSLPCSLPFMASWGCCLEPETQGECVEGEGMAETPRWWRGQARGARGIAACIPEARWSPWHAGRGKHILTLQGNSSKGWGWSPRVFQMPVSFCLCRPNTQPLPLPLGGGQIFNDYPCFHTLHTAATAFSRCLLPGCVTEVSVLS